MEYSSVRSNMVVSCLLTN